MTDVKFTKIIVYYAEWQPTYLEYGKNVEFREGLPQSTDFPDTLPKLVIIDDLMRESKGSVIDLFTKGSHHRNISLIFISQNLFHKGQREMSLNSDYIIIFKSPRDASQIYCMGRQMFVENSKFLVEAYNDATSEPHGYILLDLTQTCPEWGRVRTCIFPDDPYNYVYVPKTIKRGSGGSAAPVARI